MAHSPWRHAAELRYKLERRRLDRRLEQASRQKRRLAGQNFNEDSHLRACDRERAALEWLRGPEGEADLQRRGKSPEELVAYFEDRLREDNKRQGQSCRPWPGGNAIARAVKRA